jgi:cytochrome P450
LVGTKYNDIVYVEANPDIFSSDMKLGGIQLRDPKPEFRWPSFIAMDEPMHGQQRKTVVPMFTPEHLDMLASLIRQRSAEVLDNLPRNEAFNWVDRVSIELTTQMLATLFDFPWKDRHKLTRWSDLVNALPKSKIYESEEKRLVELNECAEYLVRLWNERSKLEKRSDLISMMAHSDATRGLDRDNVFGNLILLIVGGNDTTRNSMTGSVLALNENPDQYDKLRNNHKLVDTFVPEAIRWQTPLGHCHINRFYWTVLTPWQETDSIQSMSWRTSRGRQESLYLLDVTMPSLLVLRRHRPSPARPRNSSRPAGRERFVASAQ